MKIVTAMQLLTGQLYEVELLLGQVLKPLDWSGHWLFTFVVLFEMSLIDLDIGYLHLWFCLKCHLLILTLVIYICGSVWNVTYWYWHWLFTFVFLFEMSLLDLDIGYLHLWFRLKCHFNELCTFLSQFYF